MSGSDDSIGSWFLRWLLKAPSRWLGRKSGVGQDLTGGTDGMLYLRHLVRGNRIQRRKAQEQMENRQEQSNKSLPVLLIHGFLGTRGSLYLLEQRLVEDGFTVFSFNLGPTNTRDVRTSAFKIHRKIESILSQTSVQKIDIVGHSMGGLIGLYYIKKLGGSKRVRRLVMMGSPVHGTWAALAGVITVGLISASSWQLLPRSKFLDELNQGPLPPDVDVVTLGATRDWFAPVTSTRLRGATNITLPMGHSSLVVSGEVYKRLVSVLRNDRDRLRNTTPPDEKTLP